MIGKVNYYFFGNSIAHKEKRNHARTTKITTLFTETYTKYSQQVQRTTRIRFTCTMLLFLWFCHVVQGYPYHHRQYQIKPIRCTLIIKYLKPNKSWRLRLRIIPLQKHQTMSSFHYQIVLFITENGEHCCSIEQYKNIHT